MFEPINRKVGQFFESGLNQKLIDEYSRMPHVEVNRGPVKLTFQDLKAGFLICLTFLASAFISFLLECLSVVWRFIVAHMR